jgi:hypothetical protein
VLGDRLARDAELVLHAQSGADLEQRLSGPLREFIEDGAAGGVGQGFEKVIGHDPTIGNCSLAYQVDEHASPPKAADKRSGAGTATSLSTVSRMSCSDRLYREGDGAPLDAALDVLRSCAGDSAGLTVLLDDLDSALLQAGDELGLYGEGGRGPLTVPSNGLGPARPFCSTKPSISHRRSSSPASRMSSALCGR